MCKAGAQRSSYGEGIETLLLHTELAQGKKPRQAQTRKRSEGQEDETKARKRKVGGSPAGGHVLAVLEAAVQLCQHVLALGVGEGVAEGKVGGGPTVLQEAVHEGQHELRLHHLPWAQRGLGTGTGAQPPPGAGGARGHSPLAIPVGQQLLLLLSLP